MAEPFTKSFKTDEMGLRRVNNILIKFRQQFAAVPADGMHIENNVWTVTVSESGRKILVEQEILEDD
jgi:hypothetical protein